MGSPKDTTPDAVPPSPTGTHPPTIVLKLGTSSICSETTFNPRLATLSLLVETVVSLRDAGHKVVIVSSGAVGTGLRRLGIGKRPKHLAVSQAVAAVGQGRLMAMYDQLFGHFGVPIAQVLLTRDCLSERSQYLNARNTFRELLSLNVIPIVNENDTVSSSELRFGDNDTLSAITAGMVHAEYLFLLTDVECLYTDNPRTNPDARPVRLVTDIAELRRSVRVDAPGSMLGTGGMVTKLIAADLASAAGCRTIITLGSSPHLIPQILNEIRANPPTTTSTTSEDGTVTHTTTHHHEPTTGTHFLPRPNHALLDDRKWWILHSLAVAGTLYIDAGAVQALTRRQRSSLFAVGVVSVAGDFNAQQCVRIVTIVKSSTSPTDAEGGEEEVEIAKGLVNYSSTEIARIKGRKSSEIEGLLGYADSDCLVHRDNIVIVERDVDVGRIVLRGVGGPEGKVEGDGAV
ncbi:Aspartate/glutamate/uridylate kinase [Fimicolochytrium jonesii]|uniref:Aspartate/glutamate/uridylate kinase n=1 Tax=Fimicolochytrium jonesii TaxID=1396493 RepID=UPI0022FE5A84|nr:Aspartate/glutamate/uridylate kinase [Fimicolochytrium jonesii]KAI8820000.1 Aspartate/glutamate/uridylate kinase [Fimicolochytrium jonesii]